MWSNWILRAQKPGLKNRASQARRKGTGWGAVEGQVRLEQLESRLLLSIAQSGATVDVSGTTLSFAATATTLTVSDGITTQAFNTSDVNTVNFSGTGNASISLTGSTGDETLAATVTSSAFIGSNFTVNILGVPTIVANGGGGADLTTLVGTFNAQTGDSGTFVGTSTMANLSGPAFSFTAIDFDTVNAVATGATPNGSAVLYTPAIGSPVGGNAGSILISTPTFEQLSNAGGSTTGTKFTLNTYGFAHVSAVSDTANTSALAGGDTAVLYGTNGTLIDASGVTDFTAGELDTTAIGFANVAVVETGAGTTASLYGTPGATETFIGTSTYGQLISNFTATATTSTLTLYGFSSVNVIVGSTAGGSVSAATGTAVLVGDGGADIFIGTQTFSRLAIAAGPVYTVAGFTTVAAVENSLDNSAVAYLYDSPGNNQFYGRNNFMMLVGANRVGLVQNFGVVNGYSLLGGTNTLDTSALDYVFNQFGSFVA